MIFWVVVVWRFSFSAISSVSCHLPSLSSSRILSGVDICMRASSIVCVVINGF